MKFPIGSMSVGDVLDRGIKLLFARLPLYYLINLIAVTPVILLLILQPFFMNMAPRTQAEAQSMMMMSAFFGLLILVLALVLSMISSAAILKVVLSEYMGESVTFGQALSFAMKRFGALFATTFLAGLIIMVGFICLIIPGIYFAIMYIFVSQVVVMESISGMPALKRSQSLVKGHAGRIFGTLLLIGLANGLVSWGLQAILPKIIPSQEIIMTARGPEVSFRPLNHILFVLITQLVAVLFSTYLAICTTLLYLDMRIRKEGFDLELAAKKSGA